MTTRMSIATLAFAAALGLAACSENAEDRSAEEATEAAQPQETEFTGDLGAATQEAVSATDAAASEAGAAVDKAATRVGNAADDAAADAEQATKDAANELK